MKIGVVFPQSEIGPDPGAVREYAQAVEALGFHHLIINDHVLGADTSHYIGWQGPYKLEDQFYEPFVTLGYLAAITRHIQLTIATLILPQRQTALVAKQASQVDILSGGRLRLGIGVGWNPVEYMALSENFHDRGRRCEEQIALLRALWTQESVDFTGKWHRVDHAGINPLPVQRPIPIWLGGTADVVLRRIGRLGDGWFVETPGFNLDELGRATIDRLQGYARDAGRDPSYIGIEGRIHLVNNPPQDWAEMASLWKSFGATHLSIDTRNVGFNSVGEHIEAIRQCKESIA